MCYPPSYNSSYDGYYTRKLGNVRGEMAQIRQEVGAMNTLYSTVDTVTGLLDWLGGSSLSSGNYDLFLGSRYEKQIARLKELESEEKYYAPMAEREAEECRRKAGLEAMLKRQKEERERQLAQEQAAEKARKEAAAKKAQKERAEAERKARQLVQKQAAEKARKEALERKEQKKMYSRDENLTAFANPCDAMLRRFPVGAKVSGRVRSIKEYGAFVELAPGIAGLVHNNELSWNNHGAHASEMLNVGDEVHAVVCKVNWNDEKKKVEIALSIRQTQINPWPEIVAKYAVGSVVKGKVSKIVMHGAVVELEDGVCGFVHISKISDRFIEDVGSELSVGQEVEACVIDADAARCRIELSMRDVSLSKSKEPTVSASCTITGARTDLPVSDACNRLADACRLRQCRIRHTVFSAGPLRLYDRKAVPAFYGRSAGSLRFAEKIRSGYGSQDNRARTAGDDSADDRGRRSAGKCGFRRRKAVRTVRRHAVGKHRPADLTAAVWHSLRHLAVRSPLQRCTAQAQCGAVSFRCGICKKARRSALHPESRALCRHHADLPALYCLCLLADDLFSFCICRASAGRHDLFRLCAARLL